MKNPLTRLRHVYQTWKINRSMPLRIEFVLTDYCNLNCKGCTHYSPVAPKEFTPAETLERSIAHIGDRCGKDIRKAFLIGGEPLLYPQIKEAMRMLREHFPQSELYIFTNGIALPRMDEEFWQVARENDIIIAITRYPIKFDYDAVEKLCDEKGVRRDVFADRGEDSSFFKFGLDPERKQNGRLSHFKCYNKGCVSVIGDRIYPCSISGCVEHLNKRFGTKFEHRKGDWIKVEDVRSAEDIKRLRDKPVPFCSYCRPEVEETEYGPSQRELTEWV